MKNLPVQVVLILIFFVLAVLIKAPTDAKIETAKPSEPAVGAASKHQFSETVSYNQSRLVGSEQNRKAELIAVDGQAGARSSASLETTDAPTRSSRSEIIEVGGPMDADDQNVLDYMEDFEPINIGEEMDAGREPIWHAYEETQTIELGELRNAGETFPFAEPEDLQTISIGNDMDLDQFY